MENNRRQVYLGRPRDPSLQAYKDWIAEATKAVGGDVEKENIPEEEWIAGWRAFWGKATRVSPPPDEPPKEGE